MGMGLAAAEVAFNECFQPVLQRSFASPLQTTPWAADLFLSRSDSNSEQTAGCRRGNLARGGSHAPSTSSSTSTLPRVAWEYGQIFSCASLAIAASSACGRLLSFTCSLTARPKPPASRGPIETAQVTAA